jgi:hypothetical protein
VVHGLGVLDDLGVLEQLDLFDRAGVLGLRLRLGLRLGLRLRLRLRLRLGERRGGRRGLRHMLVVAAQLDTRQRVRLLGVGALPRPGLARPLVALLGLVGLVGLDVVQGRANGGALDGRLRARHQPARDVVDQLAGGRGTLARLGRQPVREHLLDR